MSRLAPTTSVSQSRRILFAVAAIGAFLWTVSAQGQAGGQRPPFVNPVRNNAPLAPPAAPQVGQQLELPAGFDVEKIFSAESMPATIQILALLTVLSLAPSILIMTTCFVRFIVVLGLLRQALGTQQLPPNQVLVSLSLFLTFMVMAPAWRQAYEDGIEPYINNRPFANEPANVNLDDAVRNQLRRQIAITRTLKPIRDYMVDQIEATRNSDTVWMLLEHQRPAPGTQAARDFKMPENYDQVSLSVLVPAYMLSELKTAFLIGFQLYLPFIVIDMVISTILISMGMMMLPPVLISLPFKLLLFVMIDGWHLTVGMMLESVKPYG